jgi:hypothetical protein
VSDDETGPARLLDALDVRRNAVRGCVAALVVTLLVFFVFVVLPGGTDHASPYYLALAFVFALSLAGLVTVALMARRAYHLSQTLEAPDSDEPGRGPE